MIINKNVSPFKNSPFPPRYLSHVDDARPLKNDGVH